jgi:predicted molibdopterin-dependent oxidoreductase YjgC
MCGETQVVLVFVKLPHFRLKTLCLGNLKLFVTDNTKGLTVQTCEVEALSSVKSRTGNEIVNDLKFELYDLYCSSHFIRHVRKAAESDCYLHNVCPLVRLSAWDNSAPTGRTFMKFDIWVL